MKNLWEGWKVDGEFLVPQGRDFKIHRNMLDNLEYAMYVQRNIGYLVKNKPTYRTSEKIVHIPFDRSTLEVSR